jgi:SSS family solute:Na+ symporter
MLLGNPINPINCGAIAMVGGFVVVWLASLVTPKMKREYVDRMFVFDNN